MASVLISAVTKRFGRHAAVDAVDLSIRDGEFVALLGPSGCGKTTLLRLVAGFERADGGRITVGDRLMSAPDTHVPTEHRRIGMVFQAYALWPHMTVADNVGYPLRVRRVPRAERTARVARALHTVRLDAYAGRRPAELSGGQRQRVALARCLVMEPDVVLLDEPLANLDVHLRESMLAEFRRFHAETGATMIYVTHDQAEAMALADRVAVMEAGRLAQSGPPPEIYHRPANDMVARFVGRGTVVPGILLRRLDADRALVDVFGRPAGLRCPAALPDAGDAVSVCVRAEGLALADRPDNGFAARVLDVTYAGATSAVRLSPTTDPGHVLELRIRTAVSVDQIVDLQVTDGWVLPPPGQSGRPGENPIATDAW